MRIAISGEAETSLVVPFLLAADLGGYISGALAAAPGQNNCKLPSSVALIDQWTTVCGATAPDVAKVDGTLGWPWVGETAEQTGTALMYTVPVLVAWRPRCGHNNRDREGNASEPCSFAGRSRAQLCEKHMHEGNCSIGQKKTNKRAAV